MSVLGCQIFGRALMESCDIKGDMESTNPEFALYGNKNRCERTDTVFFPISQICTKGVTLSNCSFLSQLCRYFCSQPWRPSPLAVPTPCTITPPGQQVLASWLRTWPAGQLLGSSWDLASSLSTADYPSWLDRPGLPGRRTPTREGPTSPGPGPRPAQGEHLGGDK